MTHTHIKAKQALALLGFLLVAACSNEEPTSEKDTATIGKVEKTTSTATVETELFAEVDLLSTSLEKSAFLGLKIPEVKEAVPCPYLSDEAATAVSSKDFQLKRRKTSNKRCYWSKNQGFSVELTVEPLATAKPIKDRVYNLESPPVLKDQPAPGSNAVVLYDTTWDKELAYAIAFEKDNQLVMLKVTGMPTDAALLTAAAEEVSNKLSTAAVITEQASSGTFDMCATWAANDIEKIIGSAVNITSGNLDCKWEAAASEELKQIRVTIYSGKSYPWDSLLERGAREIPNLGERSLIETKRKKSKMPGHLLLNVLYEQTLVTITVTNNIPNYEALAVALAKNIDSRF